MECELEVGDKFVNTFGGESCVEGHRISEYGFSIGDLSVFNMSGKEFSKLVESGRALLELNGFRFEGKDNGEAR